MSTRPAKAAGATEPPLTIPAIGVLLGRSTGTVESWRYHQDLPKEDFMLGRVPGWHHATIITWAKATGRMDADGNPINTGPGGRAGRHHSRDAAA